MTSLAVHELHAGYGRGEVLSDVSFTVPSGAITSVLGRNGAGKSTLLRAISGLLSSVHGRIDLAGENVATLKPAQRTRRGIVHVPEGRHLFPDLTVSDNLRLGAYARGRTAWERTVNEVFELFPRLRERSAQSAGSLSGGEAQMLAVGRGLMSKPKLLLLDEPSLGLAPLVVDRLLEAVTTICTSGVTILLAEQNVRRAMAISTHAVVLERGHVALEGLAEQVSSHSALLSSYLGPEQK